MDSYPVSEMPAEGEFLAPNRHGDWIKVQRFTSPWPARDGMAHVICPRIGRWWTVDRWLPLIPAKVENGGDPALQSLGDNQSSSGRP